VLRRREAFGRDSDAFAADWAGAQEALRRRLADAEALLERMRVPAGFYEAIGSLVTRLGVGSHRADIALLECAKGLAALDGRDLVETADLRAAADLALGHRVAGDPFSPDATLPPAAIDNALTQALEAEVRPGKGEAQTESPAPRSPAAR
jgi:Mg-chelatase subunit ChlI